MPQLWSSDLPGCDLAREELVRLVELTNHEFPFAAIVAGFALNATTLEELELHLVSVYRIALDHGHPTLPDLANDLLRWVETVQDSRRTSA